MNITAEEAKQIMDSEEGYVKLMAMASCVERVLACSGVFLADGIDAGLRVGIVEMLVSKFQSKKTNPYNAQLIYRKRSSKAGVSPPISKVRGVKNCMGMYPLLKMRIHGERKCSSWIFCCLRN